ncbi:hypothetical protein CK203_056249 [Vitis vinifera]|uniref:Uncharacterized protein n=1 Tax=Vitis vinifera TaxID=29760 RepID=A0A438GJG9_VITVI|nr:hypothetical protein CK203_056249 [Vitis vinifera]
MAAFLYFEEKVHRRSCSEWMLFHFSSPDYYVRFWSTWELGAPARPEHLEISHPEQPEEPQLVEIPTDMRAPTPTVPSTKPIPERPMSHFAGIDHFSEHPHSADDSSSCSSRADYRTQTQHTAILRQIQHHLAILSTLEHPIPILLEATDPSRAPPLVEQTIPLEEPTTGETEASTSSIPTFAAEPSSPHHPPTTI